MRMTMLVTMLQNTGPKKKRENVMIFVELKSIQKMCASMLLVAGLTMASCIIKF